MVRMPLSVFNSRGQVGSSALAKAVIDARQTTAATATRPVLESMRSISSPSARGPQYTRRARRARLWRAVRIHGWRGFQALEGSRLDRAFAGTGGRQRQDS